MAIDMAMVDPAMSAGMSAGTSEVTNATRVAVWRMKGMGVDAVGVLEVDEARIRFRTLQGIVDFDVPVADATVTFPWYRLGAGARVAVPGANRRHYLFSPPRRYHGTMQALEEFFLGPAAGATAGVGKKIAAGRVARKALGAALDGSHRAQLA